ncbi:UDP-N-acetylmuramoylalanyl-D-glutamyl-2,6-diaminopimelate--D-alanyl-D-alanine ligase [Tianweitania sediminis]|uniref:UDP-N-acetylmuramoyl-tripeptide--D-alanyl-D-alanine ligase n=1 Tax=Tianweitania sediminis TaxID=1502156 RepID=A0A8J7UHH8_9HYPH|nr:UDP-N-acetylmuramoylalanyl-D-glutamyl-2,6-diaminopimelate--D-alanyl-D-alanine ligase [Tianweitania sediminis]MBP0439204.1 UDP-N-acetylmuramoylalanyl-D-glutamyl-2,6-diaminopimelate--D-alanyl-D-alanine ligase [Tianweitania sediminis]
MRPLWTGSELAEAMNGRPFGALPEEVSGISIDSRTLQPGDAFFAIAGDQFDGHDFATAAVKAGAAVLVVAEGKLPSLGRLTSTPKIVVPDVLEALGKLGIAARARTRAKIIAVTGSNGKTSTKEALRHVLAPSGQVHAADKSFNNHWGVPLTLARMPADVDFGVFEIGMNHPGEIRPLVKMVRPHVAIITMIGAAHLGFFRDLDEIAEAKAEIFEGLEVEGVALINGDDARFPLLANLARSKGHGNIKSFGEGAEADIRIRDAELFGDRSEIAVSVNGRDVLATVGAPGRHIVQNVLAVLGAVDAVGADLEKGAQALASLQAEQGRGRRHRLALPDGPALLIDESFNANPASMEAALALLGATQVPAGGRRIAVLGDMLELGDRAPELHAGLAPAVAAARVDAVFLGGAQMRGLLDTLPADLPKTHAETAEDLKPLVLEAVRPGDIVMVKSSKGIGFAKIVDAMLAQFSSAKADETAA